MRLSYPHLSQFPCVFLFVFCALLHRLTTRPYRSSSSSPIPPKGLDEYSKAPPPRLVRPRWHLSPRTTGLTTWTTGSSVPTTTPHNLTLTRKTVTSQAPVRPRSLQGLPSSASPTPTPRLRVQVRDPVRTPTLSSRPTAMHMPSRRGISAWA